MYADDVVTFLRPDRTSLLACATILEDFAEASGLRTNLEKSAAHLIRCSPVQEQDVRHALGCSLLAFPCRYLGLPLALRKPTAAQLQPVVDKVADKLPGWRASMLYRGGG